MIEKDGQLIDHSGIQKIGKLRTNLVDPIKPIDKCKIDKRSIAWLEVNSGDECVDLLPKETIMFTLGTNNPPGFVISEAHTNFYYQIICESDAKENKVEYNDSVKSVIFRGPSACGSVSSFAKFLNENLTLVFMIIMVIGFIFAFLGGAYWNIIVPLFAFVATTLLILAVIWSIGKFEDKSSTIWIIIGIAVVFGLISAFFIRSFMRLSFMAFGGFTGYMLTGYIFILTGMPLGEVD